MASFVIKYPYSDFEKVENRRKKPPMPLLDYVAGCESWTNRVDLDLHVVARFRLWNEDYEALDSSDSVTATAGLFNVKFVFFTFLNWLVEGTFKAHSFHLVLFIQLVLREKT
jgi:hypothetical protein